MKQPHKKPQTRRERERERHRQEILDAAEEIFTKNGIVETTIEDIAKRADFAVGSIYNFFSGKNELIRQVLVRLIKTQIEDIEIHVLPLKDDPIAALRALTDLWVSHHTQHSTFLKIIFSFKMGSGKQLQDPTCDEEIQTYRKNYEQVGSRFFANGIETGHFQPLPPEQLLLIFEGISRAFLFSWEHNHDTRSKPERANELFTAVHTALTGKHPTSERS